MPRLCTLPALKAPYEIPLVVRTTENSDPGGDAFLLYDSVFTDDPVNAMLLYRLAEINEQILAMGGIVLVDRDEEENEEEKEQEEKDVTGE